MVRKWNCGTSLFERIRLAFGGKPKTIFGSVSQGELSSPYAGSQCTSMAITALARHHSLDVSKWKSHDLDEWLINGNDNHTVWRNIKNFSSDPDGRIDISEIPESLHMPSMNVAARKIGPLYAGPTGRLEQEGWDVLKVLYGEGALHPVKDDKETEPKMKKGFHLLPKCFRKGSSKVDKMEDPEYGFGLLEAHLEGALKEGTAFMQASCYSFSLIRSNGYIYVIDSHKWNNKCIRSDEGGCMRKAFRSIKSLSKFIRKEYNAPGTTYLLQGFSVTVPDVPTGSSHESEKVKGQGE